MLWNEYDCDNYVRYDTKLKRVLLWLKIVYGTLFIGSLGVMGLIIYIALHFIRKAW